MRSERGQILPLVAVVLVAMMGLAAFGIDVGHAYLVKRQLQNAVDSAALAGAYTSQVPAMALTDASGYAAANTPAGVAVSYGYDWPSPGVLRVTANAQTDTWFARVFGLDHFHVSAHAQAVLAQVGSNTGGRLVDDGYVVPIPLSPPVIVTAPVITGPNPPHVGNTLTVSNGTWTNSPTSFTYQWRHCTPPAASCVNAVGATANTYVVRAADVGFTIRVIVTATNAAGSGNGQAQATGVVAP